MNNPQPTDDRPDLRLVGDDPPTEWRIGGYSFQHADLLAPPLASDCALGPECPVCTETLDASPDLLCEDSDAR